MYIKKISLKAIVYLILSLSFCTLLIYAAIHHKLIAEKMDSERLIIEKSNKINKIISNLLYKTQTLAAFVIQSEGQIKNFSRVARTIADDPAILNLFLAPDGVVSDIYPRLPENMRVLGFDLLGEGDGNAEARMAKEQDRLVFSGPFQMVQGGQGLGGRLPVWLEEPGGGRRFWGLVGVTLKYPEALAGAGLDSLADHNYAFEIWRISPDNGQRQRIAGSPDLHRENERFVERYIPMFNAGWYFRIWPIRAWYEYPENWLPIVAGLCISLLIAFIAQKNHALNIARRRLETMLRTDPLTGLLNRQGLFQELNGLIARNRPFQLAYLDLDYFKQVNDTHGHNFGDRVLTEFSAVLKKHLGDTHALARISGDEFIVACAGEACSRETEHLWETIGREFSEAVSSAGGHDIPLSFSRGAALFPRDGAAVDSLIYCADARMYREKNKRYAMEKRRRAGDVMVGRSDAV